MTATSYEGEDYEGLSSTAAKYLAWLVIGIVVIVALFLAGVALLIYWVQGLLQPPHAGYWTIYRWTAGLPTGTLAAWLMLEWISEPRVKEFGYGPQKGDS